jgi:hypothetical protein
VNVAYFANRKAMLRQGRVAQSPDGYALDDAEQVEQFLNLQDKATEAVSRLATRGI